MPFFRFIPLAASLAAALLAATALPDPGAAALFVVAGILS